MKLKYKILICLIILQNVNLYSQNSFICYDEVKTENITSIEESFGSKINNSKLDFVISTKDSLVHYVNPKIYSRPDNMSFGKISVTYFYLESDTYVKRIHYDWLASKNSLLKDYSIQFDKTVIQITNDIGAPSLDRRELTKIINEDLGERLERRVTWKYKNAKITTLLIWSDNHGAYLMTTVEWE